MLFSDIESKVSEIKEAAYSLDEQIAVIEGMKKWGDQLLPVKSADPIFDYSFHGYGVLDVIAMAR